LQLAGHPEIDFQDTRMSACSGGRLGMRHFFSECEVRS
jgi:hypothetical protein